MNRQPDDVVQDQDELNVDAAEANAQVSETEAAPRVNNNVMMNEALATVELEMTPTGEQRPRSWEERLLRSLNRSIAEHPDSPTNYVLRGELALKTKDYGQAIADLEKALELASAQVESNQWGIVAQTMQDRASAGLTQARRLASR